MRRADPSSARRRALSDAVAAGAIDAESAEKLARFWEEREGALGVEDEPVRLVAGFNDMFVLFAILMSFFGVMHYANGLSFIVVPALAWGLSEIFARRRRMALPSIVLTLAFVSPGIVVRGMPDLGLAILNVPQSGLLGAGLAALYYWRFRVPIAVTFGAVLLTYSAISQVPAGSVGIARLVGGLVIFTIAMWRDMRDPRRVTLDADIAFWLHLAAAPMIVHSVMGLVGSDWDHLAMGQTLLFWPVVIAIWFVGVVIDRRSLIVSSAVYVIAALASVVGFDGVRASGFFTALLFTGAILLALSVWWRPIRASVLSILPAGTLRSRLPPADGV